MEYILHFKIIFIILDEFCHFYEYVSQVNGSSLVSKCSFVTMNIFCWVIFQLLWSQYHRDPLTVHKWCLVKVAVAF